MLTFFTLHFLLHLYLICRMILLGILLIWGGGQNRQNPPHFLPLSPSLVPLSKKISIILMKKMFLMCAMAHG